MVKLKALTSVQVSFKQAQSLWLNHVGILICGVVMMFILYGLDSTGSFDCLLDVSLIL